MLAKRLRQLRKATGANQAEIAALLGISREAYSMYETSRRQPGNEMLRTLADHYGVSVDYMLGRTDVPEVAMYLEEDEKFLLDTFKNVDPRARDTIMTLVKYEAALYLANSTSEIEAEMDTEADIEAADETEMEAETENETNAE